MADREIIDYSIWTCCFARGELPLDFVAGSPICSNQGRIEIPFNYSIIKSAPGATPSHLVAVDTGFATGESMTGRKFSNFERPDAVLLKLGLSPAEVDTVVLSHLHFDHAGNIDAFPKARIYVQRSEYQSWKAVIGEIPPALRTKACWQLSSLDIVNLETLERAEADGRVEFIEGDSQILPGITCHLAAQAHTFGSQWVEVSTPDGPYAVASDCVYSYAAMERMWPPAYLQGNPWNMLRAFEELYALVGGDLARIVPGHDMGVFARNSSWIDSLNPIAQIHLARGEKSRRT